MTCTPARVQRAGDRDARASSVNWCRTAWLPSRRVLSVSRTPAWLVVVALLVVVSLVALIVRRRFASAISSPARTAAAVMMSRLPAYSGR